jgi:hypothetical protein
MVDSFLPVNQSPAIVSSPKSGGSSRLEAQRHLVARGVDPGHGAIVAHDSDRTRRRPGLTRVVV